MHNWSESNKESNHYKSSRPIARDISFLCEISWFTSFESKTRKMNLKANLFTMAVLVLPIITLAMPSNTSQPENPLVASKLFKQFLLG